MNASSDCLTHLIQHLIQWSWKLLIAIRLEKGAAIIANSLKILLFANTDYDMYLRLQLVNYFLKDQNYQSSIDLIEINQNIKCIIHNSMKGFSFFLLLLINYMNGLIIMFGDRFNGHIFQQQCNTKSKKLCTKIAWLIELMALPKCWIKISFLDGWLVND